MPCAPAWNVDDVKKPQAAPPAGGEYATAQPIVLHLQTQIQTQTQTQMQIQKL